MLFETRLNFGSDIRTTLKQHPNGTWMEIRWSLNQRKASIIWCGTNDLTTLDRSQKSTRNKRKITSNGHLSTKCWSTLLFTEFVFLNALQKIVWKYWTNILMKLKQQWKEFDSTFDVVIQKVDNFVLVCPSKVISFFDFVYFFETYLVISLSHRYNVIWDSF